MIHYSLEILPALLSGLKTTMGIFIFTIIGAVPLGILIAFITQLPMKPLKFFIELYTWLLRSTPLLLQLIFVFYGLPLIGVVFQRYDAVLFAFILNYSAYFAEIFRGGIQSIPKEQVEAAKMLKLTKIQTIIHLIFPQVTKIVLPSVGNEVINLIKDTSLIYILGLGDLLRNGQVAMNRDVTLIPLILVGFIYLLMTAILTAIIKRLEKHYEYYK